MRCGAETLEEAKELQRQLIAILKNLIPPEVDPDKLLNQELWWNGPEFLSVSNYPSKTMKVSENNDAYNSELKNSVCEKLGKEVPILNICVNDFVNNLCNISNNYLTILRILSYIFRFVSNARRKVKANGPLEADELDKAEIFLIKGVQSQEFSVDIKCLQQQQVLCKGKLKSLNPFLDSDGVLRVGGLLGANREIKKLHEMVSKPDDQLARYIAAEGIKWKFIPLDHPTLTVLEAEREEFVDDALIHAKSLCEEFEISFEPPRRIKRKRILGDGSKVVQLSYEDDLRRTMFSSTDRVTFEIRERFQRL
ncbi:uncharacterized protein TNCV_4381191 [Trichonephila clavipes]|nr:uncharacterized protein TNCV_4381191 [Trichonephila clavipes]